MKTITIALPSEVVAWLSSIATPFGGPEAYIAQLIQNALLGQVFVPNANAPAWVTTLATAVVAKLKPTVTIQ